MDSQELFREVNDALRQEQWQKIFGVFGKYIVLIIFAIIFVTVAYVLTRNNTEQRYEHETEKLFQAVELVREGKAYEAREAFDTLAQSDDDAIGMMANMWRVKLKAQAGKSKEAEALAREARKKYHLASDKPYHDWFGLYLPSEEVQSDATFKATQAERTAIIAWQAGNTASMLKTYEQIAKDERAPSSLRDRAELIRRAYAPEKTSASEVTP
jgi:hypothetical protein